MQERSRQNVDELIHSFLHFDKAAGTLALHHLEGLSRIIQEETQDVLSDDARHSLNTLNNIAKTLHAGAELRLQGFSKLLYASMDAGKVDREEIEEILELYELEHAEMLKASGLLPASG